MLLASTYKAPIVVPDKTSRPSTPTIPVNEGDDVPAFAFNCVCIDEVTPDKYPNSVDVTAGVC